MSHSYQTLGHLPTAPKSPYDHAHVSGQKVKCEQESTYARRNQVWEEFASVLLTFPPDSLVWMPDCKTGWKRWCWPRTGPSRGAGS